MHFAGRRGAESVGRVRAVGKQVFADSLGGNRTLSQRGIGSELH